MGDVSTGTPLLRIHSQCVTGELLGSLRCDCAEQLNVAMRAIGDEGCGVLIYEHQEGRGIGLVAKLQAYALQDYGFDTVDANEALGYLPDHRDFALPCAILHELGVHRVRLLSNNPAKARALTEAGVDVAACLPCETEASDYSLAYLRAKQQRMGHTLTLVQEIGRASAEEAPMFGTIEVAIGELRAGRMVVVVDDEDRENEGDLVMAAETITAEAVTFMATQARGLICLAMSQGRIDELQLAPMTPDNTALGGSAFTVSIDARTSGVTTGISAADRAATIQAAVDSRCGPDDFARPGHIFPLCARAGGVLERRGHTEAAVDLRSPSSPNTSGASSSPPVGSSISEINLETEASKPSRHDLLNRQVLRAEHGVHAGHRVAVENVVQIHMRPCPPLASELEDFGQPQVELRQAGLERRVRRHNLDDR
jgi:GTP cyclohydrolase II/3,4-dihydroxy-2-butanone 4-phosphate synthase